MGKQPLVLVDVYDQDGKLISSTNPSWLRKQENERVEKLKKEAAANEAKLKKAEKKTVDKPGETLQPKEDKKEVSEPAAEPKTNDEAVNNG